MRGLSYFTIKTQFFDILFLALAAVTFEQALPEGVVVAARHPN